MSLLKTTKPTHPSSGELLVATPQKETDLSSSWKIHQGETRQSAVGLFKSCPGPQIKPMSMGRICQVRQVHELENSSHPSGGELVVTPRITNRSRPGKSFRGDQYGPRWAFSSPAQDHNWPTAQSRLFWGGNCIRSKMGLFESCPGQQQTDRSISLDLPSWQPTWYKTQAQKRARPVRALPDRSPVLFMPQSRAIRMSETRIESQVEDGWPRFLHAVRVRSS
ncbi:hypothetical protein QBC37DRAFT_401473 [Rhypophila decipiens]|uniref:Uncharacterized protein n=1 Tax=Rhypophila decipiens TaxID=261697 RepID=A0AAN6Y722_9PEZI|nr:hypothetical protein QBC37DRAFT_401473 [Rhypophila decipiens]